MTKVIKDNNTNKKQPQSSRSAENLRKNLLRRKATQKKQESEK